MVRVALMMCAICLLFSLDRGYAQDQQDQDVGRKKVDFQDGTWLSLNQTNTEVAINISPVERWVFLLGVQQNYQRIDGQERGYEFKPISDSSHTVLKMWSDGGVQYYNLLVDGQWHLGTRLHIHTDQDPERGRLRAVFLSVAPSGPVVRWWTVRIPNPYLQQHSPPSDSTPPQEFKSARPPAVKS